jgi:hypothetical protein
MRPTFRGGEIVYVEFPPFKTPLKVRDIVSANTPQGMKLHRITAINPRAVYTSGDANMWPDGWTLMRDVQYVVRFVERP